MNDTTATTEELRQALVHYRALFEDLLDAGANADRTTAAATETDRDLRYGAAADRPATPSTAVVERDLCL